MALEKGQGEAGSAWGVRESECQGHCDAKDTFYVGMLKGVGRIYQQAFIDTYCKVAFAKLYTEKTHDGGRPAERPGAAVLQGIMAYRCCES